MTLSKIKLFKSKYIDLSAHKYFYTLILLLVFLLPLWKKIIPYIIILIFLIWLFEGNFRKKIKILKENYLPFLGFVSIFILYIVGLLYTSNFNYAYFDLEVKLSLLFFPIIFFTGTYNFINFNKLSKILLVFILSCFLSSFISIINSFAQYLKTGSTDWFFYVYVNYFHHPSYISMYIELSLACIAYLLINKAIKSKYLRILLISISVWFVFYIILLSSKAGFIGLVLIALIISFQLISIYKNYLVAFYILVGLILSIFVGYKIMPKTSNRISPAIEVIQKKDYDVNTEDGTIQRIEIWKTSLEIIKKNFIFGVGTGDVKDALLDEYQHKGMIFAYNKNLNAHGQYFQTAIALGIIGLIVLLFIFLYPIILSINKKDFLYLAFLLLISMNNTVESMFENQAGVVFYAFFNSFLFITSKSRTLT
jgi:O-antigen ligase